MGPGNDYFKGNLKWAEPIKMYFILEDLKGTVLNFPQEIMKILLFYFILI